MARLLTIAQARQMTANERGRCIGKRTFRELVRTGVVPSWRNPLTGHLSIPETAMTEWLESLADHTPKATLDEWRRGVGGAA